MVSWCREVEGNGPVVGRPHLTQGMVSWEQGEQRDLGMWAGCGAVGCAPTCLTVVTKEALGADAQVGSTPVLTAASMLAGAAGAGIQLWRTRESGESVGGGEQGAGTRV